MRVGAMEFCVNEMKKAGHLSRIMNLNCESVARRLKTSGSQVCHWKLSGRIDTPVMRKRFAKAYGYDFNSGAKY